MSDQVSCLSYGETASSGAMTGAPGDKEDLSSVTAAILSGGLGTRLRPVVADRPKVMAEVAGRPFVTFLLDQLSDAGIRKVVVCTGYLGEQIRRAFGEAYDDMALVYSQESSPLGTAGALGLAMPLFASRSVLVMNGDSYCGVDLNAFCSWHCEKRASASLVLARVVDTTRFGSVLTDFDGVVHRFEEKGAQNGAGWINAGVYLINRDLIRTMSMSGAASVEREVFPAWVGRGLHGYRSYADFLDIGTPESYVEAERFFAREGAPI